MLGGAKGTWLFSQEVMLAALFLVLLDKLGAREVAAIKPEDHSSILGTHMVEGETSVYELLSGLYIQIMAYEKFFPPYTQHSTLSASALTYMEMPGFRDIVLEAVTFNLTHYCCFVLYGRGPECACCSRQDPGRGGH